MMKATLLHKLAARLWYGGSLLAFLLLPFSLLYWIVVTLRRMAYRFGLFSTVESAVPVIVVGNITVGGSGKTPVVEWLAAALREEGWCPGIVSRGYGGAESGEPFLLQDDTSARVAGDEPVLLRRLTGCPVAVCRDRAAAVELVREAGADVVIADDGMQHYRMSRNVEIAVVDGERELGNGWLLPAGPLREGAARLQEVDAVVWNGGTGEGLRFELRPEGAVSLSDGRRRHLDDFAGPVWSLAGIGNPDRFHALLRSHGLQINEVDVPDHGVADLALLRSAKNIPVIMTSKDAVKYELAADADAWYVPVTLEMGQAERRALLSVIRDRIGEP